MVTEYWSSFLVWFWNADVWLPPGFDWADMKKETRQVEYAEFGDLIYPIPLAIGLIIVRYFFENLVLYPVGERLGLKNRPKPRIRRNPILEDAYRNKPKGIGHKEIETLAKKTDLTTRQVERWLRKRLAIDKPTTLSKFSESGWKFVCYGGNLAFGFYVLWDKPWFWDINYCWYDFPHHDMGGDLWWYYMLGSGFYWSLMFSQFVDRQRRDFWQMFVHHLTTIALLAFSWTCNFTRIGTLVLILHDSADAFLEVAKMAKYANLDKICDILFGLFTIVWIITRLGIYPAYVLNSTLIEAPKIVPMFSAYYIFNSMLTILLFLHAFWTYYIVKVAVKALRSGKVDNDQRSSSEPESFSPDSSDQENEEEIEEEFEEEIKDKLRRRRKESQYEEEEEEFEEEVMEDPIRYSRRKK